jgi:protein involved in polysaccharide export with SLBB domain
LLNLVVGFLLLLVLATGCAAHRANVEKKLMSTPGPPDRAPAIGETYQVACPDILEIQFAPRPDFSTRVAVGPEGRIFLPADLGNPRVEGHTLPEITRQLADLAGLSPQDVAVQVVEYNSREVYLFGQIRGSQRAVPYRGPETVVDLLQRVGGLTPGAEPDDVYVIRSHLIDEDRPEVIHVDLRAIVMRHDQSTNVRVQPFDQIHVGETRQARIERCIPPVLRPVYQAIWDTRPEDAKAHGQLRDGLARVRRKIAEQQD